MTETVATSVATSLMIGFIVGIVVIMVIDIHDYVQLRRTNARHLNQRR